MTTTFYPSLNSLGVIPVSRLKNLEKNEGLGKFKDSAICQTGRSLRDQRDRSLIFFHKNLRITLFYMYLCGVL